MSVSQSDGRQLRLFEIGAGEEIEAYRIVKVREPSDPALSNSFKSHYESGLRPQPLEGRHAAIHMAVSLWRGRDQAAAIARRFPAIGKHLALVRLGPEAGFDYLEPEQDRPGHLTVWGDKLLLAQSVVDIVPVE
jgi:hypothetical protein